MLKNFSVIMSGGCNSKCYFCPDAMNYKESNSYLSNLYQIILQNKLPADFRQVSVTGGEPTLSKNLIEILMLLKHSQRFDKIVLTTNGSNLQDENILKAIGESVNHLNISRHAIGKKKNIDIFKTDRIISDKGIKEVTDYLDKKGVDVTFNHVYTNENNLTRDYVYNFISYAKSLNVKSVSFRYDQKENSLAPTYLEKQFADYKVLNKSQCPVCRSYLVLIKGMNVTFKASFLEPSLNYPNLNLKDPYELIYHLNGKLTIDWAGKEEWTGNFTTFNTSVMLPSFNTTPKRVVKNSVNNGCGYSVFNGCG